MGNWFTDEVGLDEPFVMAHSEKEDYAPDSQTASVMLRVPWDQRYLAVNNIMINAPEWPYRPGCKMFAKTVQVATHDGTATRAVSPITSLNKYEFAMLLVNFERPVGNQKEGEPDSTRELYQENIEPNGEMMKLPPEGKDQIEAGKWVFRWGSAPTSQKVSNEESPSRLLIGLDYVVRWTNLAIIPGAALTIVDHVNDDVVFSPSLEIEFEEETLLANAPVISRVITSDPEVNRFNMEVRWSHRAEGWNKFYNPRTGEFDEIWIHSSEDAPAFSPYVYKNFPLVDMTGVLP